MTPLVWSGGCSWTGSEILIGGVDEAGRGPLAGPVVAACAVFPEGFFNKKIADSKKLSRKIREYLVEEIKEQAIYWAVVAVGHKRIDKINIREATRLAMSISVAKIRADFVIIDGDMGINTDIPQRPIIKGDAFHQEISAASILAKVYRDQLMDRLDLVYPGFGLGGHAGYPTQAHRDAIKRIGASKIHRKTFNGVVFPNEKEIEEKDTSQVAKI